MSTVTVVYPWMRANFILVYLTHPVHLLMKAKVAMFLDQATGPENLARWSHLLECSFLLSRRILLLLFCPFSNLVREGLIQKWVCYLEEIVPYELV